MKILILGAAGFIGTNLTLKLAEDSANDLTLVDKKKEYFIPSIIQKDNISIVESNLDLSTVGT